MPQPTRSSTQLPKGIAERLGISTSRNRGAKRLNIERRSRKSQRKAARVEKKNNRMLVKGIVLDERSFDHVNAKSLTRHAPRVPNLVPTANAQVKVHKANLKASMKIPKSNLEDDRLSRNSEAEWSTQISKSVKAQLAQDDAKIHALERALGVKAEKGSSKAFQEDGLNYLLDELDEVGYSDQVISKRKREEGQIWLEKKRRKLHPSKTLSDGSNSEQSSGFEGCENSDDGASEGFLDDDIPNDLKVQEDGFTSGTSLLTPAHNRSRKRIRENPYVAPSTGPIQNIPRYVPPSLRSQNGSTEELSHLRRQLKGLLNRLSEANLLSIVDNIERLYKDHDPGLLAAILIDLLVGLMTEPALLQDTFIILHAGFIAALFRVIGPEFGAQAILRIDEEIRRRSPKVQQSSEGGKGIANLISLLAELYIFQVVSINLIYDYIRILLVDLSETNTELLLRVFRIAGHQLRQEGPSSLKEIVALLHRCSIDVGKGSISVRTKFMIENIDNLKNNKMKTGAAAASIALEHRLSMRKILGKLKRHSVEAAEPLPVRLVDVRGKGKGDKWWIVPNSHQEDQSDIQPPSTSNVDYSPGFSNEGSVNDDISNLAQLAIEQRMNTDIRRSIFIAIMSANDFNDAYLRLMRLRLKKNQELEIPKILMQCSGAENTYNPFYTMLSKRLCSDRKLKMAFQFSLWDLFKSMGEGEGSGEYDEGNDIATDDKLDVRTIVNLARMFGALVADGCLSLRILKYLNLVYLRPKTSMLVEILLATVMLQTQRPTGKTRDEASLVEVFLQPKEMADMASSLVYFLKKVVRKSDIASSSQDRDILKWGCKVACDALVASESDMVSSR